ncbi:hypothetical protein LK10_05440 [Sinomonas humi]|uniref:Uncharacterized protein n=1 Tax=Sinomonas humi TaxID=1338436 RepID=A0A0B2ARB8_9MICC|nr:hypothetical protein LK10_05440 [Sinomonas humi]
MTTNPILGQTAIVLHRGIERSSDPTKARPAVSRETARTSRQSGRVGQPGWPRRPIWRKRTGLPHQLAVLLGAPNRRDVLRHQSS